MRAQTPLWVIGKPYSDVGCLRATVSSRFAKAHPGTLRYEGPIQDRARLAQVYREARGFVLLSAMESLSLSALEAAACECPLLLSRLPWATTRFPRERLLLPRRPVRRPHGGIPAPVLRRRAGPQTAAPAPLLAGGGAAAQAPLRDAAQRIRVIFPTSSVNRSAPAAGPQPHAVTGVERGSATSKIRLIFQPPGLASILSLAVVSGVPNAKSR